MTYSVRRTLYVRRCKLYVRLVCTSCCVRNSQYVVGLHTRLICHMSLTVHIAGYANYLLCFYYILDHDLYIVCRTLYILPGVQCTMYNVPRDIYIETKNWYLNYYSTILFLYYNFVFVRRTMFGVHCVCVYAVMLWSVPGTINQGTNDSYRV